MSTGNSSERVGATNDIERRKKEYASDGYEGLMYYAETKNMQRAENQLLESCKKSGGCPKNAQKKSNAEASPGCVYVFPEKRGKK